MTRASPRDWWRQTPARVKTRAVDTLSIVLAIVSGALFLVTGGVKVLGVKQSLEIRDHFGMQPGLWRIIGTLETAGAVGVLIGLGGTRPRHRPPPSGLGCLMLGAIANRLKGKDSALMVARRRGRARPGRGDRAGAALRDLVSPLRASG